MKALQKNLEGLLKGGSSKVKSSSAKSGEKTPRAPTAWTAWTQHCHSAYAEEYAVYKEVNKGVRGVAILFAKHCQAEYESAFAEFSSAFSAAHPPVKKTKATPATAKLAVEPAPTPVKKTKTSTPAAPKKEKKAAVTPVKELFGSDSEESSSDNEATPAAAADEDEDAARLWTWKSKKYFRTSANECWVANADGSMGKWAGVYDPIADSIDADAEEPEIEAE